MGYLFLAIPNFCGSSLMHSLLETVPSVVPLTQYENGIKISYVEGAPVAKEGYRNYAMGPHSIETNMLHVHQNPKNYDWDYIKMVWEENWADTNPYATIKLQKTPGDVLRLPMVHKHFHDLKWILSVRNPYAYVESIFNKINYMNPLRKLPQICYHVTKIMELQKENREFLGDDAYVMTYEDFVARPEWHREQMSKWIPDLKYIDFKSKDLIVKEKKVTSIKDESEEKIEKWVKNYPDIISKVNEYFEPKKDIINYWGYELRS